ncbi:PUA-like domain-containing protein [Haematococcus lacustris]
MGSTSDGAATGSAYDPSMASQHLYLGSNVQDLSCGGSSELEEGSSHTLPVLIMEGVVLLPGCKLPLMTVSGEEVNALRLALAQPPPLHRLIVVLYRHPRSGGRRGAVARCGCSAELRQLEKGSPASPAWRALALGRQRVALQGGGQLANGQVRVTVLPLGATGPLPWPFKQGYAAIAPQVAAQWDLDLLAARARSLCRVVLPGASGFLGPPHLLAYWLAANLPLEGTVRQQLLEARDVGDRLRQLIQLMQGLGQLACASCGAEVAHASDSLAMTQEGVAAAFVNAHGYVHDMVTLSSLAHEDAVAHLGAPTAEHCWFPGYAWTICLCNECGAHLGWRYTRVLKAETRGQCPLGAVDLAEEAGKGGDASEAAEVDEPAARSVEDSKRQAPLVFWGFRRDALARGYGHGA